MQEHEQWVAKAAGSMIGVLTSMVMVAPRSVVNGVYRGVLGLIGGVVFAPAVQNIVPFLRGMELQNFVAAACFSGFCFWFVFEVLARFLSRHETLVRLLEEMARLKGK